MPRDDTAPDEITRGNLNKPSFLGIGAQRAATTWVYGCLRAHPEVDIPAKKEIHYFDDHYEEGPDWYASHFEDPDANLVAGEITPNYLYDTNAAERIATDFPDAKLFVILRDPVSRARSSYELFRENFEGSSFLDACEPNGYLVRRSLYAKPMENFYSLFDRDQILVLLYEDISDDPESSFSKICQHIGVSSTPPERQVSRRTNSVVLPRTQKRLEAIGLGSAVEKVKRGPLGEFIRSGALMLRDAERRRDQRPSKEVLEIFRNDVSALETQIDRDLENWLRALEH